MTAVQWYVIDTRTDRIVNAILTGRPGPPSVSSFLDAAHLRVTTEPSMAQLHGYRYWSERP